MTVIRIILSFIICTIGWVCGFFGVQTDVQFMAKVLLVIACILVVFLGMIINSADYRPEIGEMGLFIVPVYAILFPIAGPFYLIKGIIAENVSFSSRDTEKSKARRSKARKGFIVARVILGTLIVAIGYIVCFSGLGSIDLLITMAIGDLILVAGVWIAAGGLPSGEKTHYTSTVGMIFGWLFKIIIQPILAAIAMVLIYKQLLSGELTSEDSDGYAGGSSYTDPDDYVDNTGIKTGGMRKLKTEVGILCNGCHVYANSHYISAEIKHITPSFLSHMIDLKVTFTINSQNLQTESDVSYAKSAIEDYFSQVSTRVGQLQNEILSQIQLLIDDGYTELEGNWRVETKYSYSIDGKWHSA